MKKYLLCFLLVGILSAQTFIAPMQKKKGVSGDATVYVDTMSYTGTGVAGGDDRAIDLGGQYDWVMIKGQISSATLPAVCRSSTMTGDSTKSMGSSVAYFTNGIQSLTATGMVIGTDTTVNGVGVVYHVTMIKNKSGTIISGSYTGNATDNRWLTGLGLSAPDVFIVWANSATSAVIKTRSMELLSVNTWNFITDNGSANIIQAMGTVGDSIQLGTSAIVNGAGVTYQYFGIKYETGLIEGGTYTGDGGTARQVVTSTFQPNIAWVIAAAPVQKVFKNSMMGSTTGNQFIGPTATTNFGAFHATGITVNNINTVNSAAAIYHYVVFKAQ